jgi:hypothetical protein
MQLQAIVGVHHEPFAIDLMQVCYSNWHINGCGDLSTEDAAVEILEMVKSGTYDLASIVTHEYKLEQIAQALTMGSKANEAPRYASRSDTSRAAAKCAAGGIVGHSIHNVNK